MLDVVSLLKKYDYSSNLLKMFKLFIKMKFHVNLDFISPFCMSSNSIKKCWSMYHGKMLTNYRYFFLTSDCSSGYGSTHDISDSEITPFFKRDTQSTHCSSYSCQEKETTKSLPQRATCVNKIASISDGKNSPAESMSYRNTTVLSRHLQMIISIPDLCDIIFEVGPQKVKVNGVKAILGSRSR